MKLPKQGFVLWPVGTGDSTTIVVDDKTVFQLDIHHLSSSTDEGDPHTPIIDTLVKLLPKVNGKPYLAVFALTHPDEDHCKGFADLKARVHIGELWFTPRVFAEYKKDLCDDAKAFLEEAKRRVKKVIRNGGNVDSGDRVRIIGYDELLKEEEYEGFPKESLSVPGHEITELDGVDHAGTFRAFVHAPFKDDAAGERNDTSLGLQITLKKDEASAKALLFGDLSYPIIKRIFTISSSEDLKWNIFLAPHHCSKSVMYWQDEGDEEEKLKQDILDSIENASSSPGYIVASSEPIPATNKPGDNPPHARAKNRYEEIVPDEFLCTQEHPDTENPEPIIFQLTEDGLVYVKPQKSGKAASSTLSAAVTEARGDEEPPRDRVGFGRC